MLKTHYALECIKTNWRFLFSIIFFLISTLLIFPQNAQSATVELCWDAIQGASGYIVCRDQNSTTNFDDCEPVTGTCHTFSNLQSGTWHFAVKATNSSVQSDYSNVVTGNTITATAGQNGEIYPQGDRIVEENTDIDYTISADSGFKILDVLVDGFSVQGAAGNDTFTYPFTNVVNNHTIVATFEQDSSGGSPDDPTPDDPTPDDPTTGDPIDLNPFITSVEASDYEYGNIPENTTDGDPDTRWAAENEQWIQYNFSTNNPMIVSSVNIAWRVGDTRIYTFDIEIFNETWTTVYSGESTGTTSQLEEYVFEPTLAEAVRIRGYGNSSNDWNNITEVVLYGSPSPSEPTTSYLLPIVDVTASDYKNNYVPENTIDGDLSTRWFVYGDGQYIEYDLGDIKIIDFVKIAWTHVDGRVNYFDIEVSSDYTNWTPVYSGGQSSGTTRNLEEYNFNDVEAQFIRIIGYGNSDNNWNSITEVEIYGK